MQTGGAITIRWGAITIRWTGRRRSPSARPACQENGDTRESKLLAKELRRGFDCGKEAVRVMAMQEVLNDVGFERVRQEDLRRSGKFLWTCAVSGALVSLDRKMSVLSEEVGEVAKEVVDIGIARDKYDKEKMAFPRHRESALLLRIRKELVQVAAVCVAWIEAIDVDLDRLEQRIGSGTDQQYVTDLGQPPTGGEAA